MTHDLQGTINDEGELMSGMVVMTSYYWDRLPKSPTTNVPASAEYLPHNYTRYCDRPMDWRTRLFGIGGTAAVIALVLSCALFSWRVVKPMIVSSSAPLVVELRPLAAPPEPVREVAPGPEQVERQEAKPEPKPDIVVPPPLMQLPVLSMAPREAREPVEELVDPGPAVPETTAPKSIAAPSSARVSSDAKQSWEARLLAHLERYRRFPARARAARQQGTVYVRFQMNRSGAVLSAAVVRSSGFATLDQAALDTLNRAQPLPAIPNDKPDTVELTIPVEFFLNRRG
ncbi:outer membrane transport energization protein TonB [Hephaestia caeni]|uniref:Protein TonB n=1 Tax=Hephaestia caeni TaxID=645617 RepID=A0A397PAT8_9SPHN|nr:energy transducer TonB [Hephaestia caeni]RIA46202.1 outer membrane transport energization protein TonB [Hephaestia caeni]